MSERKPAQAGDEDSSLAVVILMMTAFIGGLTPYPWKPYVAVAILFGFPAFLRFKGVPLIGRDSWSKLFALFSGPAAALPPEPEPPLQNGKSLDKETLH